MHILIMRVSAIGDVIHTLPALFLLKHYFPNATIHWVVQQKAAPLLEHHPLLKHTWVLPDHYFSPYNLKTTAMTVKKLRTIKWDAIIDFQGLAKTSLLHLFLKGKKFGFSKEHTREKICHWTTHYHDAPTYTNIVQKNLSLASLAAQHLGAITKSPAPENLVSTFLFTPTQDQKDTVDAWLEHHAITKPLLICPNTTWPSKHWPPAHWVECIRLINEQTDLQPILIGATMGAAAAQVAHECHKNTISATICPPWGLLTLTHLIKQAHLLVCPDSGLLHLADYLGTPVIGIFGPTSKIKHGPFWTKGNNEQSIQVPCPHHYKKHHHPGGIDCMAALQPQTVIQRIQTIINNNR